MLLPTAFVLGALLGWQRAGRRGGDRLDKLQYAAVARHPLCPRHAGGASSPGVWGSSDVCGVLCASARRQSAGVAAGVPGFLEALDAGLALYDVEAFYYLARATLVKDERHIDRFDRVFAAPSTGSRR